MLDLARGWWLQRKEKRLTAERVRSFADADVLVVSFTKSGRTWLRVLLSNLLSRRFGLSDKELIDGANFHRRQPQVPKVFFAPDTRFPYAELGPAQVHVAPQQKVVFLVRDPRDVIVSFYFHVLHRASGRELRRKQIPPSARDLAIDAFVLDDRFGVTRVIDYMNRWAAEGPSLPNSIVLRYEDLVADTVGELERLVRFVGLDMAPDLLADAVAFASFESLRKKEREGYFQSDRLGLARAGEEDSGKVRAGRVGGYRDRLGAATVKALDRLVAERLNPGYGYR